MKNVRGDGHLLGILLIDPLRQQNGVDRGIQNSLMIGSFFYATEYKYTVKCGESGATIGAKIHYSVNSSDNANVDELICRTFFYPKI